MKQIKIAHAGGEIAGHTYTNSVESILNSLKRGFRYIEIDFFPAEGSWMCWHETGKLKMPPSDFLSRKVDERFTSMDVGSLGRILKALDFVLVTDTKGFNKQILPQLLKIVKPEKILPEVYSEKDALWTLQHFPDVILIDYLEGLSSERLLRIAVDHWINYIAIPQKDFSEEFFGYCKIHEIQLVLYEVSSEEMFTRGCSVIVD